MKIQENILLAPFTTFRIGGPARYFASVDSVEDLKEAVLFAREKKLPFLILGGGSNILVSDSGIDALVVKIDIRGIELTEEKKGVVEIVVGAGEVWDNFVHFAVENNFYGIENLSLIPGTVGAAPVQNIGAYGAEVSSTINWVEVFDTESLEIKKLTNSECHFGYRDSIFKHSEGKNFVITRVSFHLQKNGALNITYKDVEKYIKDHKIEKITLEGVRQAVIAIRTAKLPDIKKLGTAGSFFKNPIISRSHHEILLKKYPDLPSYVLSDEYVKIPVAWIFDTVCKFRGFREGNVGVYENQALVLVNFGNATSSEVLALANRMKDAVKEKTGIDVEFEVNLVG